MIYVLSARPEVLFNNRRKVKYRLIMSCKACKIYKPLIKRKLGIV